MKVLILLALIVVIWSKPLFPTSGDLTEWLQVVNTNYNPEEKISIPNMRRMILDRLEIMANDYLETLDFTPNMSEYPYLNFFPLSKGSVLADGDDINFEGHCFSSISAKSTTQDDGQLLVTLKAGERKEDVTLCSDVVLMLTVNGVNLQFLTESGEEVEVEWTLPDDTSDSEKWDLDQKGVRVFMFPNDLPTTAANYLQTKKLFIPLNTKPVPEKSGDLNMEFLNSYTNFEYTKRDEHIYIPEHLIHSGDFFGVIRMDGMDPVFAYAMGFLSVVWLIDC